MAFEDLVEDTNESEPGADLQPPEESNNRTFLIVAGILGGLILLSIICIAVFAAIRIIPEQQKAREARLSTLNAQSTLMVQSMTETAAFVPATATPTHTRPAPTATPVAASDTPVIAPTNTRTPILALGGEGTPTATIPVSELKTQLAIAKLTGAPTALPKGGFADEVGAPGLAGMAIVLIIIIILARKLRSAG